jgi:hypothetical protein
MNLEDLKSSAKQYCLTQAQGKPAHIKIEMGDGKQP